MLYLIIRVLDKLTQFCACEEYVISILKIDDVESSSVSHWQASSKSQLPLESKMQFCLVYTFSYMF